MTFFRKTAVRRNRRSWLCALLAALLLVGALAAQAESDRFISEAGIFDYLSRPNRLPQQEPQPSNGWMGLFYAEGVGLEARIYAESEDAETFFCDLYNYNAPDDVFIMESLTLYPTDGGLQDSEGLFLLHELHNGSFTMEISPDYLTAKKENDLIEIYGSPTSVSFTDAALLLQNSREDSWGGAYFHDVMTLVGDVEVYDDLTLYLSLVQLYGTGDYYMVSQREHYGEEMPDILSGLFVTESDGALIHDYGISIVTGENYTVHYRQNGEHTITCDAGDDGMLTEYRRCSTKPMWGD